MKKNYIFDLYGTLIDIHTNEDNPYLWEKMSNIFNSYDIFYMPNELKNKYKEYCNDEFNKLNNNSHIIEINIDKVFKRLLIEKNNKLKLSKNEICKLAYIFRVLSRDYMSLYPFVIKLLDTLKENNANLYLLSNAQRSFSYNEIKILGLEKYFDDIFISSDLGIKKPDKEFLNKLIQKHNLKKEESILIGNEVESDIKVAYLNNIDSILINTNRYGDDKLKTYKNMFNDYKFKVIENMEELLNGRVVK